MSEQIKILPEELQEFNYIKDDFQKTTYEFGVLYIDKMELDEMFKQLSEKESELRNKISKLQQKQTELMDKMLQKYGEGSLDIKEGIFIKN